jgi:hypothetical protein
VLADPETSPIVKISKDDVYKCFAIYSLDEKTAHEREQSGADKEYRVVKARLSITLEKLHTGIIVRETRGQIYGSKDRLTWQRPVYATAFNKFYDPAVELSAAADIATTEN